MNLQPAYDIVTLNVLVNAFHAIAEEMGINLLRSARSTIIREARDCSCALFDPEGRIVAEAEHIPVQMSSLSLPMRACLAKHFHADLSWPDAAGIFRFDRPSRRYRRRCRRADIRRQGVLRGGFALHRNEADPEA